MKNFTVLQKINYNDFSHNYIKRNLLKAFSIFLFGVVCIVTLQAQTTIDVGANYANNVINLPLTGDSNTTDYIITGTTSVNKITITSGYNGTITLRNLSITSSTASTVYGRSGISCITVEGQNDRSNLNPITKVDFILDGSNALTYTSNNFCALQVNQGAQIHINAIDPNNNASGILVAKNTAPSTSSGGGGAAIGAPNSATQGTSVLSGSSCSGSSTTAGGNIIIGSGTVTAQGGHGAGIGGGWYTYYNGIIIVYGGIVETTAGRHAAGIGSGCPTGNGVISCYAENSTIIALPPAQIEAYGRIAETNPPDPALGLAGSKSITYMNDPNRTAITVHTVDYMPNIPIYLDLTETLGLVEKFQQLGLNYDFLKKVRVGYTGNDGKLVFRGQFEQLTTFFTDASSTDPNHLGRPYLPVKTTVVGLANNTRDIELPYLDTDISFIDYPSTPLELGYSAAQAQKNAHVIKMEYRDPNPMTNVTFSLQSGATSDFRNMFFLESDSSSTVIVLPQTLNQGDIYYIVLPIVEDKTLGIYQDVLLITGEWQGEPLPGYIRRVGMQRVVKNDTGQNHHIKVTANPNKFIEYDANSANVVLTLNINHTGTDVNYDPLDVKAKYIITTHANYNDAVAATPVNNWTNLSIPNTNNADQTTTVPFDGFSEGMYYIHWYVESGVVYAHSLDVISPPAIFGGFGPYIITTPVVAGTISGNSYVCAGIIPSEIHGEASTGGSGNFTYSWEYSSDQITWNPIAGSNSLNYTPTTPLAVSPTYFRRITTDTQYGGETYSNSFKITEVPTPTTLYWNPNAQDNNWNNPANWLDALNGNSLGMVPLACTDVFISNIQTDYKYPSLDNNLTPTDVYGPPVCRNITFAYGAELAYQHKLQYEKAFVRYNWGYYTTLSTGQPSYIWEGTQKLKRDQWHILSAPLKSMATGDFSLAGLPFSWQKKFEARISGSNVMEADFSGTFPTNDIPLTSNHNAIAVKMAAYQDQTGYHQVNLEGLKGVLEFPYFENTSVAEFYTAHHYDALAKRSYLYYFDTKTLKLINSPLGMMKRAEEAYRFVYETPQNGLPPNNEYEMLLQSSGSVNIMVGNPLLAGMDADAFASANFGKINSSEGFKLLSDDGTYWEQKSFLAGEIIPAWKAFIVTLVNPSESTLSFPLEASRTRMASAGTRVTDGKQLLGNVLFMQVLKNGTRSGDQAELRYNYNTEETAIQKMIIPEGHATPEVFFIDLDKATAHLVQPLKQGQSEIGIGVKTSDTQSHFTLEFLNIPMFTAISGTKVVLIDKLLGVQQDISRNPTYQFTQNASELDGQYVDKGRFALQLVNVNGAGDLEESDDGLQVELRTGVLKVTSDENIDTVTVYDLYGRMILSTHSIDQTQYTHPVVLQEKICLVQVKTTSGNVKVKKVMNY